MNKRLISLMAAALALLSASGQVWFTDYGEHAPIEVTPESSSSSLKKIFVVYDTKGVTMNYASPTGKRSKWSTFDSYPDTLQVQWDGYKTMLKHVQPNTGYIIDDTYYCWVVDCSYYFLSLNDMFFVNDDPCGFLTLRVDGTAPKILYKNSVDGPLNQVLDREIKLSYNTLVWSDSLQRWKETPMVETFESLDDGIQIPQPLCNTMFTLSGDRFLEQWGIPEAIDSGEAFRTRAVSCHSTDGSDNENDSIQRDSAPVNIVFTGYPTDAVAWQIWEIARDIDFEEVIYSINQDVLDYTFYDTGTYYVRYSVANDDGSCKYSSDEIYTVTVSESELACPNIFSPGSTEGVNDIWKVHAKSLVEFHCWIFNRWGTLVCEFTDPDDGWDGTYHGRLVDPGVFYYVVTATGSDGVSYKKRGDITILHYKRGAGGASTGGSDY